MVGLFYCPDDQHDADLGVKQETVAHTGRIQYTLDLDIVYGFGTAFGLMQPTAYVITVVDAGAPGFATGQANLAATVKNLERWGWDWQLWPATVPSEVDWASLRVELLPRGAILKRPGAQACFHSHYRLWQHCVTINKPIVVMEHDAHVTGVWPQHIDLGQCVWKLTTPDGRGDRLNDYTGTWSCGAWAYTLTPRWAAKLIEFSRSVGAQAVDKQIGSSVVDWSYWPTDLVTHRPAVHRSTTSPKVK